MASIVQLKDDDYLEYQANIKTIWGSTFLRADSEEDFVVALLAVLPRTEAVHVIPDKLKPELLVKRLLSKGYSIYIKQS